MPDIAKFEAWVVMTDDMLVDAGYDVPGYAERKAAEQAESDRYWRSLSRRVRLWRTLAAWYWRLQLATERRR